MFDKEWMILYSEILKNNDTSIFIASINKKSKILIGVPHHTPSGTVTMPCKEHLYSDENVGYIGAYIAEKLKCSFLCACNYFIDVNKNDNSNYSDYYTALKRCKPKYLVEIHGHGMEHSGNNIEISSGSKEEERYSLQLKDELDKVIDEKCRGNNKNVELNKLKEFKINANFDTIYFKATRSATIIDKNWISFHIELPVALRIIPHRDNKLPSLGEKFAEMLYEAIKNICI